VNVKTFETKEQWLDARRNGVTATDAPVILGVSPWKKSLELFAEKVGLVANETSNEAMEWGTILEDPIAGQFAQRTKLRVSRLTTASFYLVQHPEVEWLLATPDRLVAENDQSEGLLEIKTASAFSRDLWLDEPPLYYQVQLQHQLAVTGHRWGVLTCLLGGQQLVWHRLDRNDAFIERLIEEEQQFMARVRANDPPPPDETEGARRALQAMYPNARPECIALPGSLMHWDEERQRGVTLIAEGEALKRLAENHIIAALGESMEGEFANGVRYSYKSQTRRAHMVEESTFRVLRRKEVKS